MHVAILSMSNSNILGRIRLFPAELNGSPLQTSCMYEDDLW